MRVVSADEARQTPYPYVYVNADGSCRELHSAERATLEQEFDPADGARPYVKKDYDRKDGWGSIAGYLARTALPADTPVAPAPEHDPFPPLSWPEWLSFFRSKGLDLQQQPDGTWATPKRKKR